MDIREANRRFVESLKGVRPDPPERPRRLHYTPDWRERLLRKGPGR